MVSFEVIQDKDKLEANIGTDRAVYAVLFLSAFALTTLLPGPTDAALLTLLAMALGQSAMLVLSPRQAMCLDRG